MTTGSSTPWWRRLIDRGAEPERLALPVDCSNVAMVIQRYLDGELVADADTVAAHLDVCRACGLEAATYDRLRAALARPSEDPVGPEILERLRAFGADIAAPD